MFVSRFNAAFCLVSVFLGSCLGHPSSDGPNVHTPSQPSTNADHAGPSGNAATGAPATGSATTQGLQFQLRMPVSYPPMAVDYVNETLRDPATGGHATLEQGWEAIADLSNASLFSGTIGEQVKRVASGPVPPLVAAWVSANPDEGGPWLVTQLNQGHYLYLQSLAGQPAAGRVILHQLKLDNAPRDLAAGIVDLLRYWQPLTADDEALLKPLAGSDNPATKYRAIGYLMSIGKASDEQVDELKQALQSAKNSDLAPAAEACRISQDERLASALVTGAAGIALGAEGASDSNQHDSTALYTAYALTFLPGAQAKLLRQKLLGAADSQVRWQARLGELLHGDMDPWYSAALKAADDDRGMWLALQPDGIESSALLNTYLKTSQSKTPDVRLKTALELNRYAADASNKDLSEILSKLMQDKVEQIAAQAWHSAALDHVDGFGEQAQKTLDDQKQPASVRMAAAFYELKLAEPAPVAAAAPASSPAVPAAAGGSK